jgi:hypothetical protein
MRRGARKYAVRFGRAGTFAPGGGAAVIAGGGVVVRGGGGAAFDVVVETPNDVARAAGVIEVGGFGAEDGVFDVGLWERELVGWIGEGGWGKHARLFGRGCVCVGGRRGGLCGVFRSRAFRGRNLLRERCRLVGRFRSL